MIDRCQEKENLTRELQCVDRETRIAETALKDNRALEERLSVANKEIDALKEQMRTILEDKDLAVKMLNQIIATSKPNGSLRRREAASVAAFGATLQELRAASGDIMQGIQLRR